MERKRKRNIRRLWYLALALLLVGQLTATRGDAAQTGVYFTVADRRVLEMEDATMPFMQDGQWYIPHTVFTQQELDVFYGRTHDRQTAYLMTIRQTLSFDLVNGTCYDQSGRSYYNIHAIVKGDVVFFPLNMVANFFDLNWSYRNTFLVPMIRITDSSSTLSDDAFLDAGATLLQSRYNDYLQSIAPAEEEEEPETPAVSTPAGQRVYLLMSFSNFLDAQAVLDNLEQYGGQATVAFTAAQMEGQDDLLRQLVGQGHAVAIALEATTEAEAVAELAAANAALWDAACSKTRLVFLTQEQSALASLVESLGYTVCDIDVDYSPYPLTGSSRAGRLYSSITSRSGRDVCVYLGDEKASAPGLGNLLSRMEDGECRILAYRETLS